MNSGEYINFSLLFLSVFLFFFSSSHHIPLRPLIQAIHLFDYVV